MQVYNIHEKATLKIHLQKVASLLSGRWLACTLVNVRKIELDGGGGGGRDFYETYENEGPISIHQA